MKIEFFYKETGNIIKDPADLNIDYEGDVFEINYEYDDTHIIYHSSIGWRVIDG